MRVNRNIRLLEAHALLVNMMFAIPVLIPYYRDEIGLSFRDFLLGEAAFAATLVLLDVPMGWVSDLWQRKLVLALGTLIELNGFILLLAAHGLATAMLAQVLIGVGICFLNGTNTALLYESLMAEGREAEYRRREGRRNGFGLYSVAAASLLGGMLYPRHHRLPVILTGAMQALAILAAGLLDEPERRRRRSERHPLADIAATTHYALRHPQVGLIIVFAGVLFCSTKLIMWTQQPYYILMGLKENVFGLLMGTGFVLGGFSSQLAYRLDGKVVTRNALVLAWAIALAACLGAAVRPGWHGVALLILGGSCIWGMATPRVTEAINRYVDSARRATVLSTQSLCVSLLFIPVSWVMGRLSESYGVRAMLVALAGWLGLAGLGLAAWSRRSRTPQDEQNETALKACASDF
jgi:MFS family permease